MLSLSVGGEGGGVQVHRNLAAFQERASKWWLDRRPYGDRAWMDMGDGTCIDMTVSLMIQGEQKADNMSGQVPTDSLT